MIFIINICQGMPGYVASRTAYSNIDECGGMFLAAFWQRTVRPAYPVVSNNNEILNGLLQLLLIADCLNKMSPNKLCMDSTDFH
jgi:hypothetical protein